MTDLLWMPASDGRKPLEGNPNYLRAFDARVTKAKEDWILLDRTAFYAEGGGQPSDVGKLTWDGGEARVTHVAKKGVIKHALEGDVPPPETPVHGEIDWDLRYDHMRMHTSQHLLSAVVYRMFGASTAGNQIHADRSRVDFEGVKFDTDTLKDVENAVNRILEADLPLVVYEEDRDVLRERMPGERTLLDRLPKSVRRLRVVEVTDPETVLPDYGGTVDVCPCAGTHVARTGEIGRMEILGRETKGKDRDRVSYLLK